ncbi:MAG: hypothetical protein ING59_15355 [Burkholderiales bacterium]|nr:hypothetical protein [Burkholderiales bacterium]
MATACASDSEAKVFFVARQAWIAAFAYVVDITRMGYAAAGKHKRRPRMMRQERALLDGALAALASNNNEKPSSPAPRLLAARDLSVCGRGARLAAQRPPTADDRLIRSGARAPA